MNTIDCSPIVFILTICVYLFYSVRYMHINQAFGVALKKIRKERNRTQEDFGIVSSRTYVSTLERGLKSITLEKLEELANVLDIHPMTLIAHAYILKDKECNVNQLLERLKSELDVKV